MKVDKYISKDAEDLQDWKNLRVMFKFLETHIRSMINKETHKPKHFKNSVNGRPRNDHHHEEEEEKVDTSAHSELQKKDPYEEDKYEAYEDYREEVNMQKCGCCKKYITPTDEKSNNQIVLECCHFYHKDCMEKSARKQYLDNQQVKCHGCGDLVATQALNVLFGAQFVDDLNEKLLRIQLMEENNMIECTCGNLLEVEPGKVDYKQKDEEGKVISRQAAENMAKFRVRCNNCNRVFCSNCNAEPYHVGKTCEEFEEYRGADKCRFCLKELKKIRKNCHPAFMAVCKDEECERLMQNCCTNQLD